MAAAQFVIYENKDRHLLIKQDLRNSVTHVFGNHISYRKEMCDAENKAIDKVSEYIAPGAHHHVYAALNINN